MAAVKAKHLTPNTVKMPMCPYPPHPHSFNRADSIERGTWASRKGTALAPDRAFRAKSPLPSIEPDTWTYGLGQRGLRERIL